MFGSATRGDVLKNINLQYVRGLLGRHWAHLLVTVCMHACWWWYSMEGCCVCAG